MAAVETAADLIREAERLHVGLTEVAAAKLFAYLDLLYLWNRKAGLTRVPRTAAASLHLLDSLAVSPLIPDEATVVDLGSGAGLPGLPLALLRPDIRVTLVESNRRKCSFLGEARRELGLGNLTVERLDAGEAARSGRAYDVVVSRAFRPPMELLPLSVAMTAPGGAVVLMTADPAQSEVQEMSGAVPALSMETERRFTLPGGEKRCLILLRNTAGL